MDMSFNANAEVYVLPFRPLNDNQCSVFKQKNVSNVKHVNIDPAEMLEIRITELPKTLEDPVGQSRLLSVVNNDLVSAMKHQELDLDTLNQLIRRDMICISGGSCADTRPPRSEENKPNVIPTCEVRTVCNEAVISYPQDFGVIQHTSQVSGHVLQNLNLSNMMCTSRDDGEGYIVYSSDNGILNTTQVVGVSSPSQQIWTSEQSPKVISKPKNSASQTVDFSNGHLVPIEVEGGVVFIDAAPSLDNNNSVVSRVTSQNDTEEKFSSPSSGNPPCNFFNGNMISFVMDNGHSTILENPHQQSTGERMSSVNSTMALLNTDLPIDSKSVPQFITLPPASKPTRSSKCSSSNRSVLKASIASKQVGLSRSKLNLSSNKCIDKLKNEEHFSSLVNQSKMRLSQKLQVIKKTNICARPPKKPQSLAVVAISSDKTKDITRIVVNTSKGEQIFKGKTSELINATPNLWCVNSKTSSSLHHCDETSQNSDSMGFEDDEAFDDQPMADALIRLGFPANELTWVQNTATDERMWFCPEKDCKRLFPRLHLLKVHILGHYGERPYKCDFPNCQWAFYTHFKLKRHQVTHLQRKDFKCDTAGCGRSFTTIYNLNSHKRLHKRPAEIVCPVEDCPALFQTRRTLELHLKEHGSDHAPYMCPYTSCLKRYYTVNSVNSHIRSHQHKDDEIRCQWAGCGKVFDKPCRLKAHMRTHTGDKPYPCTYPGCNWAFSSSSKLKRHQHKHTNVRKFECHVEGCGKMFMRSEHLKEHTLTHSSERTFHCSHPDCNMRFSAKSSLYVHSKKHRARMHSTSASSTETSSSTASTLTVPCTTVDSTINMPAVNNICTSEEVAVTTSNIPTVVHDDIAVVCPLDECRQTFTSRSDLRQHITSCHVTTLGTDSTQQLELLPLLAEDESLVAELVSIQPVTFSSDVNTALDGPTRNTLNDFTNNPQLANQLNDGDVTSQVAIDSEVQTEDENIATQESERDSDIEQVVLKGSARSSITIDNWRKLKRQRLHGKQHYHNYQQQQQLHHRQQRRYQGLHQQPPKQRVADDSALHSMMKESTGPIQSKPQSQEGLPGLRAPMDVVLGAGLLGAGHDIAHLLLPDELAASSDLYCSEDGILTMESSFVPSTINLRDLE